MAQAGERGSATCTTCFIFLENSPVVLIYDTNGPVPYFKCLAARTALTYKHMANIGHNEKQITSGQNLQRHGNNREKATRGQNAYRHSLNAPAWQTHTRRARQAEQHACPLACPILPRLAKPLHTESHQQQSNSQWDSAHRCKRLPAMKQPKCHPMVCRF